MRRMKKRRERVRIKANGDEVEESDALKGGEKQSDFFVY